MHKIMLLKNLLIPSFFLLGSSAIFAKDIVNCVDVKVSKNVSYSTCSHHEDYYTKLKREDRDIARIVSEIKVQAERTIESNWYPPMGYSGYSVDVVYSIDQSNSFYDIKVINDYVGDDLKNSLYSAFNASKIANIPDDKRVRSMLKNIKSTFIIR